MTDAVPEPAAGSVGTRARRGIMWTAAGQLVANLVRLVVLATLGRLLAPGDFGVVAAALSLLVVANTVRDLGVGMALVQHKAPTRAHVATAFALSAWLALAIGGAMFGLAEPIAAAFRTPALAPIVRALAGLVVLRGLCTVPLQLANRAMDFRALALIDVGAYVCGSVVSVGLALTGAGPWALVWGYLVETGLTAIALFARMRPPITLRVRRRELGELLHFGAGQTLSSIANTAATEGDYLVVARTLGQSALGFYTRAYELISYPATMFTNIAGTVLFSMLSRQQDDRDALARAYLRVLFINAAVLVPASAGLVLLGPEAIRLLMGPGWDAAVLPLQIMAVSMLLRTSYKAGALIARARGDVYRIAAVQCLYAINIVVGASIASAYGIAGVAVTTTLGVGVQFVLMTWLGARHSGVGLGALIGCHLSAALGGLACMLAALPTALALRAADAAPAIVLLVTAMAGAFGAAAYAAWQIRRRSPRWLDAWQALRSLGGARAEQQARKAAKRAAKAAAPADA